MAVLRWMDRHPGSMLLGLLVLTTIVLRLLALGRAPILLGRATADHRLMLYGQFGSSAVALLAASLTALTVMIAVPDRTRTEQLRATVGWRLVQRTILVTALLCLVTLIVAHLGAGIDDSTAGRKWIEALMLSSAGTTVIAVITAGLGLLLALTALDAPEVVDAISYGRGSGAG